MRRGGLLSLRNLFCEPLSPWQVCGQMVGPQWFDVASHSGERRIPGGSEDPCLRQLSGHRFPRRVLSWRPGVLDRPLSTP